MAQRITPAFSLNQSVVRGQELRQSIAQIQAKITANKSVLRPSEAPDEILTRASLRGAIEKIDANEGGIDTATSRLNQSSQVLQLILDRINDAKQLALSAESDSTSRAQQAAEVDSLLREVIRLSNSTFDGEYLFSGAKTTTAPYESVVDASTGRTVGATYSGSERPGTLAIYGTLHPVRYSGSQVFAASQKPVASQSLGNTGIQLGTGVGSAQGIVDVVLSHGTTTFGPGSGVAAGTSSAGSDTILGPAGKHNLFITDSSGTGASGSVRLNNGEAVSFTSADQNLKVTGPGGEVVYLDMSAITPGFVGNIALQADGSVSIDGGASSVALSFSNNQVLTHTVTGEMVTLDTTNVSRAGQDALDIEGTADLFQTLAQLRDDLLNTRNLSDRALSESVNRRIGDLDRHFDHVNSTLGAQSVTLENLESIKTQSEDLRLTYRESLGSIEEADLATLASDLVKQLGQLQISYSAMSSVMNVSLLDFLR